MNTPTIEGASSTMDYFRDGTLPPLLVRASAGTGKTYRLTARLLQILFQGAAPESILATTFTRKAAGEILDRVLETLAEASDPNNTRALEQLREQIGIPTLPPSACLQLLKRVIANIHRIRICTLDSFFTQLARSFPFELQLPPGWRLTDEIEEMWLRERAVQSVIATLEPAELGTLMSMLSKGETKRSIARELISVVGGAYTLGRRSPVDAWETIQAPTQPDDSVLTRAAGTLRLAEPPQKRVREKLQAVADIIESRDFRCPKDKVDQLIVNYAKAKALGEPVRFGRSLLPDGTDEALGDYYAAVRSKALSLLEAQNRATGNILQHYDHQITSLKQATRTLGFDDVSVRLAETFAQVDHETLSRRMDGSIDHVLLDEFQDTSPTQWEILRPLARRAAESVTESTEGLDAPIPRSFFCVGDTKQAIYSWRGGAAEIFDAVDEEIEGVTKAEQNVSYRSSPVILDTVNQVFQSLHRHPMVDEGEKSSLADRAKHEGRAVKRFAERFPTHVSARPELPGYVRMETSEKLEGSNGNDENIQLCCERAADKIAELVRAAPHVSIGVLTRTNKTVAILIYLLDQRGIEVSQEGGNPLIDSAAVELVLSALMMTEHPGDGRWKYHVDHSPMNRDQQLNAQLVRDWLSEHGIAGAVYQLADRIIPACDEREAMRLKQLVQLAIRYEVNAGPRIREFVEMVRQKRVERPRSAAVRVMTVHQAKGLEFDAVFLPEINGKVSGRPSTCVADVKVLGEPPLAISRFVKGDAWHFLEPSWQRAFGKDAEGKVTEALCLLYVAMTRARQALYLIAQPCKPEDKKPAALLHCGLASESDLKGHEELLYESGDAEWHRET